MSNKLIDETGSRFGRLTVIARAGSAPNGAAKWLCQCDCGNRSAVVARDLRAGVVVSCGCHNRDSHTIHGHWKNGEASPTYRTWQSMKARCLNPRQGSFRNYGGRGIGIVPEWIDSFEQFLADMGERPPGTTLDRIDNEGDYEPGNCRWATPVEQVANRRPFELPRGEEAKRSKLKAAEVLKIRALVGAGATQATVAKKFGVSPSMISQIIRRKNWTHLPEEAAS